MQRFSGQTGFIIGPKSGSGNRRPITAGLAGASLLLRNHFSSLFFSRLFAAYSYTLYGGYILRASLETVRL